MVSVKRMETLLVGGAQLEQELSPSRESMAAPVVGSLLLHGALAACLFAYGLLGGLFHANQWGSAGGGGAIQVSMTSALPLPADHPPNENVLATETPSEAPAEPTPKAKQAVDETAIPISGKQKQAAPQSARQMPPHTQQSNNRAQYGEQAGSSMPRALPSQGFSSGPTSLNDGSFGTRFGWYVDNLNRKMASSWYKPEVDPHTPHGARVYLTFTINRAGTPSDVQIERSSGSATLDRSCQRGVQRVDTFGALPSAYNSSTLKVSYYCEY
jgi:protein TonB